MLFYLKKFKLFIILFALILSICIGFLINTLSTNSSQCYCLNTPNQKSNVSKFFDTEKFVCLIDGVRLIPCIRSFNETYLPFYGFIKKQFDIFGELKSNYFDIRFSDVKEKMFEMKAYSSFSEFGMFSNYNVELRKWVRCIHPAYGVPMSTQWRNMPYFYPIQIAQFALQHYSRMIKTANVPRREVFLNSVNSDIDTPSLKIGRDSFKLNLIPDSDLMIVSFLWNPLLLNSSFYIELKIKTQKIVLDFYFTSDPRCVWMATSNFNDSIVFTYSLGGESLDEFMDLKINIKTCLISALKLNHNILLDLSDIIPLTLTFRHHSIVAFNSMKQMNTNYKETFLKAAEWFVANQDVSGGWATYVDKKISKNLLLKSPWYSALAQGHALSVLTRAYNLTIDKRYLESGKRSLKLFLQDTNEKGVVNKFFDNIWYEEYPTNPGNFVLNGFMYSLIGLYDFSAIDNTSLTIFEKGLKSLKNLISLFDTGSSSLYDLRHVTLITEPRIARWEYHTLHICLLKWLFIITGEKTFDEIANRWISYTHGYRASHN